MIAGTTIFHLDGNAYHNPEFPRGGLAATFTVEVMNILLGGAGQVDVVVEHRNTEDTTWSTAGTFSAISSIGAKTLDVTGLKEVVRLSFAFSGGTPAATDAIHFLIQAPSWRPYA
jgi:hypothetical protein